MSSETRQAYQDYLKDRADDRLRVLAYTQQLWNKSDKRVHELFDAGSKRCSRAIAQFQIYGVRWMMMREHLQDRAMAKERSVRSFVLGDDVGLGKTYQIVRLIFSSFAAHVTLGRSKIEDKTIIVAPVSLISQWQAAFQDFLNKPYARGTPGTDMANFVYVMDSVTRPRDEDEFPAYVGVVLVPYSAFTFTERSVKAKKGGGGGAEVIGGVPPILKNTNWHRLVLDEGHCIKNDNTRLFRELSELKTSIRIVLTATPLQNNLGELKTVFRFIGIQDVDDIAFNRRTFVLRRLAELEGMSKGLLSLPPLQSRVVMLRFRPYEQAIYNAVAQGKMNRFLGGKKKKRNVCGGGDNDGDTNGDNDDDQDGKTESVEGLDIHLIMPLRQICVDQRIFLASLKTRPGTENAVEVVRKLIPDDMYDIVKSPRNPNASLEHEVSTKIAYVVDEIVGLKQAAKLREKSLIFCEWHSEMAHIKQALAVQGVRCILFDGRMSRRKRDVALKHFRMTCAEAIDVLVLQINCGATGLNLQCASRIFIMSPTWNPSLEMQAIGRAHRFGMLTDRTLRVQRIVMEDMVDHRCLIVQEEKKLLVKAAMHDQSMDLRLGAPPLSPQERQGVFNRVEKMISAKMHKVATAPPAPSATPVSSDDDASKAGSKPRPSKARRHASAEPAAAGGKVKRQRR